MNGLIRDTRFALARLALPALMVVTLLLAGNSHAAPTINQLSLRGLQTGATTTLAIDGADLPPDTKVLLPVPIAKQEFKPSTGANRVEVEITLDATVTPGIYPLRVANGHGISNAVLVGVDHLAERAFAAEAGPLPVALDGSLAGGTILRTVFDGKAGQRVVVDLESRRLGSKLNPVVHLLDARNAQIAWGQTNPVIAGDARVTATLPADGRYTVELHDALYRGAEPGAFRLKIGDIHFADGVFPLGGRRGTKGLFELIGTNLAPGQMVEADLAGGASVVPAHWPSGQLLTGTAPPILVGDLPEIVEHNAGPNLQSVAAPAAIDGRLLAAREEDRYLIGVTPGQTLRFDLTAARAGSPLDGVLAVRKETGEQLATADDAPTTTDPTLDFKIPDGVAKVVVAVRDLLGRGGAEYAYRLTVAPTDRPDFRLEIFNDREQVPNGGAEIVRVRAQRMGYQGPIQLALAGLPAGVLAANGEIPAGATDALVSLSATGSPAQSIVTITGTSVDPQVSLARTALLPESAVSKSQPWLRSELAMAATGAASVSVAWDADSAGIQLPLGSRLPARVKIGRAPFAGGAVRLALVTSQIAPKKEVTENNQKRQVDDADRTIRLEGTPTIAADQAETTATILVPADLANIPYDLAIRAELLAADGKNVVASVITPARRLTTIQPLRLELAGEPKVEAKAGTGETGRITGKVQRIADFPHPVTVTLVGLPAEYLAPTVDVPAGATDFSLAVTLPFNSPPSDLANVSVVATARAGGGRRGQLECRPGGGESCRRRSAAGALSHLRGRTAFRHALERRWRRGDARDGRSLLGP